MKTVEDILQKRYEVSAGKARVAQDMVDMDAVQEKENERKALEQTALAEFLATQGIQATRRAAGATATPAIKEMGPINERAEPQRVHPLGKFVSILLVVGLIALGVYMIRGRDDRAATRPATARRAARSGAPEVADVQGRGADAVAAGAGPDQGQHRPDRDQRVRRLRRA